MRKEHEKIFITELQRKAPAGLLGRILLRIKDERDWRSARVRVAFFGTIALAALGGLIPAWRELHTELSQSGFAQFVLLLFSDAGFVAAYWREFGLSLAESLPILGISAILGSAFAFLLSARFLTRDLEKIFQRSHLQNI